MRNSKTCELAIFDKAKGTKLGLKLFSFREKIKVALN